MNWEVSTITENEVGSLDAKNKFNADGWTVCGVMAPEYLSPGTLVTFRPGCKLIGKTGTVLRKKTKNFLVIVEGKQWNVPPYLIASYKAGNNVVDPSTLIQDSFKSSGVVCNAEKFYETVVAGDVCLFFRGGGAFDIARIDSFNRTRVNVTMLNGRGAGKKFLIKADMFVQKLDKELFGV